MTPWQQNLYPASWRGIPFGVKATGFRGGRDTALHEYPFRDEVWVEDVGKATRKITLTGFLVGDDMPGLQQEMIDAAEAEGPGELIHPLLGMLTAVLVNFTAETHDDLGRVIELQMTFLETGPQGNDRGATKPAVGTNQKGDVLAKAGALEAGSVGSFASSVGSGIKDAVATAQQVQRTCRGYISTVTGVVRSASNVMGSVSRVVPGLDRTIGRYTRGLTDPLRAVDRSMTTVSGALGRYNQARSAVGGLSARVQSLAARL